MGVKRKDKAEREDLSGSLKIDDSFMLKTIFAIRLVECVDCEGGCARCTFRLSYEDLDAPLTTAVQCTEPPSTDPNQTRQVLLNDGRQFVLTTALTNDSDGATFQASSSAMSASRTSRMQVTADPGSRTADDAELPNDLSLRDEAQAAASAVTVDSIAVPPCPVCHRSNFATHMELSVHVNNTHLDVEDVMD